MQEIVLQPKQQQKSQPSTIIRKRSRYRLKNQDITSMRYECFCSKQYLSYAAVWQHLKKSHYQFHCANKYFSATNIIQTQDPLYGFKIKKILREKVNFSSQIQKVEQQRQLYMTTKKRQSPQQKKSNQTVIRLLQIKLNQSLIQNGEYNRKMVLSDHKILKYKQMIQFLRKIIDSYEQILRRLKIKPIVDELDKALLPTQQDSRGDGDDEQYLPGN